MAAKPIAVSLAYATSGRQVIVEVSLAAGATIADAIECSGLRAQFPDLDCPQGAVGVWGKVRATSHILRDGDRVEIYRPLALDPKEARRRRASGK